MAGEEGVELSAFRRRGGVVDIAHGGEHPVGAQQRRAVCHEGHLPLGCGQQHLVRQDLVALRPVDGSHVSLLRGDGLGRASHERGHRAGDGQVRPVQRIAGVVVVAHHHAAHGTLGCVFTGDELHGERGILSCRCAIKGSQRPERVLQRQGCRGVGEHLSAAVGSDLQDGSADGVALGFGDARQVGAFLLHADRACPQRGNWHADGHRAVLSGISGDVSVAAGLTGQAAVVVENCCNHHARLDLRGGVRAASMQAAPSSCPPAAPRRWRRSARLACHRRDR